MTSKEALEELFDRANHDEYLGRSNVEKSLNFLQENSMFKDTILQDLDRLKNLKKVINDKINYLEKGVFLTDYAEVRGAINILKELKETLENCLT